MAKTTNRNIWWIKSVFWWSGARASFIARFLPLIFQQQNLTDSQIGIILSSSYFSTSILVPIISGIADLKSHRYLFLMIAYFVTAIVAVLFLLPSYWLDFNDNIDFIFYYSLIIMLIYSIPNEYVAPFLDALCLLSISNNRKKYGQIRSFTAMSWGLFHCIIGVLLEFKLIKLHWNLYLFSLTTIPGIFSIYFAFKSINTNEKRRKSSIASISDMDSELDIIEDNRDANKMDIKLIKQFNSDNDTPSDFEDDSDYGSIIMKKRTTSILADTQSKISMYITTLKFIFSKAYTIGLFVVGFTFGGGWMTVQSLLFVYITDLNSNDDDDDDNDAYLLMGLSVLISVIFEIPFMYCSEWFIKHLGYRNMIFVGFGCYVLRLLGYSLLTEDNLWFLLIIETLQGFTMGLIHVAIVTLSSIIFPEHLAVTAQGLMSSIRFGFAPFLFLFAGGYIMEYYGGVWLYRMLAMVAFLTIIIFYFLSKDLNKVVNEKQNFKVPKETKNRALSIASDLLT